MVLVADTVNGLAVRQDLLRKFDFQVGWVENGDASIIDDHSFGSTLGTGSIQLNNALEIGILYQVIFDNASSGGTTTFYDGTTAIVNDSGAEWFTATSTYIKIANDTGGQTTSVTQMELRKYDLETGADWRLGFYVDMVCHIECCG
jgi:hypothetical protein